MSRAFSRFLDGDVIYSFKRSPGVMLAAALVAVCIVAAMFAPWVAPHNPFDLKTLNLLEAFTPPAWSAKGNPSFLLGTDGREPWEWEAVMPNVVRGETVWFFARAYDGWGQSSDSARVGVVAL